MSQLSWTLILPLWALTFTACQKSSTSTTVGNTELVSRGHAIYQTNCTACHNADPRQAGSLGPDVYGSSKSLLEARILRADYPPDYKAKRMTHVMNPLPHLKNEIDALHAFLNSK